MSLYVPDNWVILKFDLVGEHYKQIYKVLAGWSGGYLSSDSWRMNSSILSAHKEDNYFLFYGYSGSVYKCHEDFYGLRNNNSYVYNQLVEKYSSSVCLLDRDTDWLNVKYT